MEKQKEGDGHTSILTSTPKMKVLRALRGAATQQVLTIKERYKEWIGIRMLRWLSTFWEIPGCTLKMSMSVSHVLPFTVSCDILQV